MTAAVGKVIGAENVSRLGCRLVVPIANNTFTDYDQIAPLLQERSIVDVVESQINWGGALAAASELFGYDEDRLIDHCFTAYQGTLRLLQRSKAEGVPPWQIAKAHAREQMKHPHPIVETARRFPYIGDLSGDLRGWICERWLTGRFEAAPDEFADHVAARLRHRWQSAADGL
ncbi:MAG: hypothetical protein HY816_08025 [Candidatus Wallbacteria bacterium]|nr:hypothetical protein [Candidatus Wallbacteria bacterium]